MQDYSSGINKLQERAKKVGNFSYNNISMINSPNNKKTSYIDKYRKNI